MGTETAVRIIDSILTRPTTMINPTFYEIDFDEPYPVADSVPILEHMFSPSVLEQWSELAIIEEIEINAVIEEIEWCKGRAG